MVLKDRNGGSTLHTQTRPQETPLEITDRNDKGWRWVPTVQQSGDMLARLVDGRAPDAQGVPQPMHEERLGSRS